MSLTKNQKNKIYDELFNRMLRPSEATDNDLVMVVESVIGTGKNVNVTTEGNKKVIKIGEGADSFEVKLLTEVPTDIDGNFTFIQD